MSSRKKKDKLECPICLKSNVQWHKTCYLCMNCYFAKECIDFGNSEISIKITQDMKNSFLTYLRKKMDNEFILTFKQQ